MAALGDATRVRAGSIGSGPAATTPPKRQGCFPWSRRRARATMAAMVERVLLASPRGYCAGVERAVETVEQALELYGPPVYVRKQIVHNAHVVRDLEARGAIFVDSEEEVPRGRDARLLGPRRRAVRARELRRARPQHDRRHLPARDEGARAGAPLRGRRLHDRPDRPRRPRGGRGHDGRGARRDHPRRGRRRGRGARAARRRDGSPTSPRRRSPSTRRREIIAVAPPPLPARSTRRRRRTSATRPPTGSGRSRRCSPRSTCCS